jgi:hypothetical protein
MEAVIPAPGRNPGPVVSFRGAQTPASAGGDESPCMAG